MPDPAEITKHWEPPADHDPWVGEASQPGAIEIVAYDARWPDRYLQVVEQVRAALGNAVLGIQHIGSTSVPGLAAKPVIDIDLTVADPREEPAYAPALQRAGFVLRRREPHWHEHRLFQLPAPRTNLHVFGPECPEVLRHRMFRDWLSAHPDERVLYETAKLAAAAKLADGLHTVLDYNKEKEPLIREIYARMFRAHGLL